MTETAFKFDQAVVDDALRRIQDAAKYVGGLGRHLPKDPVRLGVLQQQVEDLRVGLIVMTSLADGLQQLHDQQAARTKELAWAVRAARGAKSR